MPPRKRISNITRLLPRKRSSTPDPTPTTLPVAGNRDCTSLPAGFSTDLHSLDEVAGLGNGDGVRELRNRLAHRSEPSFGHHIDPHELRVHRFAKRYEEVELRSYRDYLPVEEDVPTQSQPVSPDNSMISPLETSEQRVRDDCQSHKCDVKTLRNEISLLRENHTILSETVSEALRLAETLEARIESLQRRARASEKLFWMLLDALSAVVLFIIGLFMKPWVTVRRWFVEERVRKRRSWRLSVGELDNDPFLGDVAKRLSFSAVDD